MKPADFKAISDLVIKLSDLKIVQADTVGESLLPRVELVEPGKGEGAGTLVELKDTGGKTLAAIVLGKKVLKKDPGNPLPAAQNGVPAARYVRVLGGKEQVVVQTRTRLAGVDRSGEAVDPAAGGSGDGRRAGDGEAAAPAPQVEGQRFDLVLAGREVQVRQVLLELSQVEITQVAQIAKAHVLVPPVSLSNDFEYFSTHNTLCQTNTAVA